MSRRHRGRPHQHAPGGGDGPRRGSPSEPSAPTGPDSSLPRTAAAAPPRAASLTDQRATRTADAAIEPVDIPLATRDLSSVAPRPLEAAASAVEPSAVKPGAPVHGQTGDRSGQCTAPQLRRFIKSRPYVPMHELRRRFSINGDDDDVTPVRIDPGWIYVGLPVHEGHLLGDLLRTGEIGYELSLDPRTPIVIGVYPMRPIPRT